MTKKNIQIQHINIILIISITLSILSYTAFPFIRSKKTSAVSGTLDVSTSSVSNTGTLTGVKFSDRDSVPYFLDPARSLTTNLVALWHLEESSGSRSDAYGGNTLTDNTTTVTQATGKIGYAGQFTAINSEYLNITDNANLSMNSTDFTLAAWVYADSLGQNRQIISKDDISAQREYGLYYLNSTGKFRFAVLNSSGTLSEIEDTSTSVATGTWYLVIGWHDDTNNTINIQINNATAVSTAYTSDVKDGTANFNIGRIGTTNYWNGKMDEVALWKRVLTASERTILYNSGNGINLDASLTTSGNVGIGTTSPKNLLHVASTDTLTGKATLIVDQLESQDILAASASGTNKFVILNNGNVGIGTTAPATALDVNGTINASVFGFDVETKTAECSSASCVATAACTTGYTYIAGFRATGSAACDTNPSACSAFCGSPGTASCTVTSTSNNAASVYIICGKTN